VYCPIIPVVAVVTSLVIFYIKSTVVVVFASPPKTIYSASAQVFYFMMFLGVTLLISSAPIWYAMTNITPSVGPHNPDTRTMPGVTNLVGNITSAYDVVPNWVKSLDEGPRRAVSVLGSITVLGPLIMAMALWAYYLLALANKRFRRLSELENEVKNEREEKKFYIKYFKVQT
jgi:hypothetical protein